MERFFQHKEEQRRCRKKSFLQAYDLRGINLDWEFPTDNDVHCHEQLWGAASKAMRAAGRQLAISCDDSMATPFNASATVGSWTFDWKFFLPYAMRRGGATHMFLSCGFLGKVIVRGRWASASTARLYINEGAVMLNDLTLGPRQKQIEKLGQRRLRQWVE